MVGNGLPVSPIVHEMRIDALARELSDTMVDRANTFPAPPCLGGFPELDEHIEICNGVRSLTPRQREVMKLVVEGHPSKIIAADLKISRRTVENHRASIMRKTGSTSIPALVRYALYEKRTDNTQWQGEPSSLPLWT